MVLNMDYISLRALLKGAKKAIGGNRLLLEDLLGIKRFQYYWYVLFPNRMDMDTYYRIGYVLNLYD